LFPTAEEAGLYGSFHYVNNPIFPLEKTVACVNLDMLGRVDKKFENITDDYVYISNHNDMSGTLVQRLEDVNKASYDLTLDYKYSTPGDPEHFFERSDQYNFAVRDIPSIFLTSGDHDDYHRPTDDTEKINFKALQKRTQLAFLFIRDLANSSDYFTKQTHK
jgi:Zn-dependent M28 family amino/carboxypeptidase